MPFANARRLAPLLVLALAATRPLPAQTTGELGAFSALMVSPVGALPPLARDIGSAMPDRWDISLRYGGWQYDVDDGDHNNVGITVARRVGRTRTTVAMSAAYLSLDCACSVWGSGSIAVRSTVWTAGGGDASTRRPSAHFAMQEELGGARYTAVPRAGAVSAAATFDLGVAVPFWLGMRLRASALPGVGFGHLWSVDETASAWRPLMGGALSLALRGGFALDLGAQRVVISRGPSQYGAGLSWSAR